MTETRSPQDAQSRSCAPAQDDAVDGASGAVDAHSPTYDGAFSPLDRCWLCDEQHCDAVDAIFDEPVHRHCLPGYEVSR